MKEFRILPEAVQAVQEVQRADIPGWYKHSLYAIASLAAIPGDYLEIGTYYGASAIAVALTRRALGIPGKIVCLDPLEVTGSYDLNLNDSYCTLTKEKILDNAKNFGVELELITERSLPWPEELQGRTFSVAYIDGDHRYPYPEYETGILIDKVTQFLAYDDYEPHNLATTAPLMRILENRLDWALFYKNGDFLAMSRQVMRPSNFGIRGMVDFSFNFNQLSTGGYKR